MTPLSVVEGAGVRVRQELQDHWGRFVAFGVALILLGIEALGAIGLDSATSILVLANFLMLAGILQTIHALRVRGWGGFTRLFLAGVFSLVVGVLMLANAAASGSALRLLAAAFFLVAGTVKIAAARFFRFPGRRYAVTSDVATILFGLIIGVGWPVSGDWAVGTFVGFDLILGGWSLAMAALAVHELGHRTTPHLRLVR